MASCKGPAKQAEISAPGSLAPRDPHFGATIATMKDNSKRLEERTVAAAEAALAERNFVTAIDVLQGIGWLPQARVDEWRQGRLTYLEGGISTSLHKISAAMQMFRSWAQR